jgi:hypothetical protein
VVLGAFAGFALEHWLGVASAGVVGVFAGILAANFVPLPARGDDCDG